MNYATKHDTLRSDRGTEYKRIFAIEYKDIGWKRFIDEIVME